MSPFAPPIPTTQSVEEVLSHLERLPYLERRIFIKRRMPDQYPRFFYKYFKIDPNNSESVDRLRDVIVRSRFWLADHERFNDPFDLKASIVIGGTEQQRKQRLKALIANQSGAPRKERREYLQRMMGRSNSEWNAALQEIFRTRTKEVGVCSFAGEPRSILMWTHYGKNHEGVCLQFEMALAPRTFTLVQEVQYSEEYPELDYVTNFDEKILIPLVRKHKSWEYEREWRILHLAGANSSLPFNPQSLRRVVLGCRASPAVDSCINSLLQERNAQHLSQVQIFRAEQHPTQYKLRLWRSHTPP